MAKCFPFPNNISTFVRHTLFSENETETAQTSKLGGVSLFSLYEYMILIKLSTFLFSIHSPLYSTHQQFLIQITN